MAQQSSWPEKPWDEVVDSISKIIFRIYSGDVLGTGFIVGIGESIDQSINMISIATAWHVVKNLPGSSAEIRLVSADQKISFDSETCSIGFHPLGDEKFDTCLILINTEKPIFTRKDLMPLFPFDSVIARGGEIAWLGYPGFVEPELCFFQGYVSGYLDDPPLYLVDGVAINGVSGGPAFDSRCHLIGMVSAYLPNRVNERVTLPGLMAVTPINSIRYFMENVMKAKVLSKQDLMDSTNK